MRLGRMPLAPVALLAVLLLSAEAGKPPAAEEKEQSPVMAAKEAEAVAGLEKEYNDALTDIMAVLLHGSDASKEAAIQRLVGIAVETGEAGAQQARLFRSAVVAGGALPALVSMLSSDDPRRQHLACAALHALALDDPDTDEDNFHQEEICNAGAVPPLVELLKSSEHAEVQVTATGALSTLAENPSCQKMITEAGAVAPLLSAASYGTDMVRLGALGALDVLELNNPPVRDELFSTGGAEVLQGISSMGSDLLRDRAKELDARLSTKPSGPKPGRKEHVKEARATRVRYDGVRERAFRMMGGWGEAELSRQRRAAAVAAEAAE